jgi:hypothetical protein
LLVPFIARYILIYPQSWNNRIALRFELYGCPGMFAIYFSITLDLILPVYQIKQLFYETFSCIIGHTFFLALFFSFTVEVIWLLSCFTGLGRPQMPVCALF